MFTGIIEDIGTVTGIVHGEHSASLTIQPGREMNDLKPGESMAVNGVCLTVSSVRKSGFTADVMPETMRRTNLGKLNTGSRVNLEQALPATGRFGGHIVSGHIDGTGTLISFMQEENAIWVRIRTDKSLLRYMVEKGSVAVDGISLTIAGMEDDCFLVSVIPFTQHDTVLTQKKVGDTVNIECDILAKYVERMLQPENQKKTGITWDLLNEKGFM
jgi:riboflavin synthase